MIISAASIRDAIKAWEVDYNLGNYANLSDYYTTNAILMAPGEMTYVGRKGMQRSFMRHKFDFQ